MREINSGGASIGRFGQCPSQKNSHQPPLEIKCFDKNEVLYMLYVIHNDDQSNFIIAHIRIQD